MFLSNLYGERAADRAAEQTEEHHDQIARRPAVIPIILGGLI